MLEFCDADVIVPLTVVEELDGLKSRPDDVGRSARTALRTLEELRVIHGGSLAHPVPTGNGTSHAADRDQQHPQAPAGRARPRSVGSGQPHHRRCDRSVRFRSHHDDQQRRRPCASRRRTWASTQPSIASHVPTASSQTAGWTTLEAPHEAIDCLYGAGAIAIDAATGNDATFKENEFAVLRSGSQSALVRSVRDEFVLLSQQTPEPWGLRPRSKEQRFSLELLTDPDISVIALDGRAGTGKTILAIAAGLEQVIEQPRYERLAVYRPLVPVGRADVGFLPGGLDEKLDPWMAAIHDAVVALTDRGNIDDARDLVDELTSRGKLSLESVTFLRGRSLQRQFVVIDEAQNLEPTTLRTILTRVGDGTKVIFTRRHQPDRCAVPGRVEQCAQRAHVSVCRAVLFRSHHADRMRAQRRAPALAAELL